MDFYKIIQKTKKKGNCELTVDFKMSQAKDLMVRGGVFYAVWNEELQKWSTDEFDIQRIIDKDLYEHKQKLQQTTDDDISVKYVENYSSGLWSEYRDVVKKTPNNFHMLDSKLTFSNSEVKRSDYSSKSLPYPLEEGDYSAWDEIVSTLYDPSERAKIEWAIGAIVKGDAKNIQKFAVLYGDPGTGKGTILKIIEELFDGYYTIFESESLTSSKDSFSTASFKNNPLVGIEHDGNLSRIKENTTLNSIVSHEEIIIKDKYEKGYPARINCFLFIATNNPVKITDAKSGLIRRLIDINPSGRTIPRNRYDELIERIPFELGAIAWHCKEVYEEMGKNYYNTYKPLEMMYKTDVFYNFVESNFDIFKDQNGCSLKQAWDLYKFYCDDTLVPNKLPRYKFREELKNYFKEYKERDFVNDQRVRSYYSGFLSNKFIDAIQNSNESVVTSWLKLDTEYSLFDDFAREYPAQLANDKEAPAKAWSKVNTTLGDIDTHQLHYVRVPENHIVIDFDIKDENGMKSFAKNFEAASKFPPTYAELSKSGAGIHLHYIYDGDVSKLESLYAPDVEIKVYRGRSALRRKLSKCNSIDISTINSGLPLKKEEIEVVDEKSIKSVASLRNQIKRNLRKEIHPGTKPSIDFIYKILEDAYNSGLSYDVSDMYQPIYVFASNSTHQAKKCLQIVKRMKFMSKDYEEGMDSVKADLRFAKDAKLVIFDVEVFKNLFVIVWKYYGAQYSPVAMVNPTADEVHNWIWTEDGHLRNKLIGFNNRKYDNHIIRAGELGFSLRSIYERSAMIINKGNGYFKESYGYSYTDIYMYVTKKQSLKKYEIEYDLPHMELGIQWDQPVPDDLIKKVIEYCKNDVLATEAVWDKTQPDFKKHEMLAAITGSTVNDTTNTLTTRMIFGNDKNPQKEFNYRFMGDIPNEIYVLDTDTMEYHKEVGRTAEELISEGKFSVFDMEYRPVFPGYVFDKFAKDKSTYRGEVVGEGGYVFAEWNIWLWVYLLDIASQHPTSIEREQLFGPKYTARFSQLKALRIHIKHGEYDIARDMMGGIFKPYLNDESDAKQLSTALKIPINSVYGLTSASFDNPFRDPRNVDNIVAKRGALFMINLKHEVQKRGYTVAHIKTDSIKIPNGDDKIKKFVMEYGKAYGYDFEHEETYDRMCLVNNAVYIAKYSEPHKDKETGKDIWWTATGAQFQHPYVFKRLFTKEPIVFKDMCETRAVQTALYLDMNENLKEDEHNYVFVGKVGSFCPMKKGTGGGLLVREKDGKYYAASATTGYRWMESEIVKSNNKENDIDISYFEVLSDAAKESVSKYGNFEWFVSDKPIGHSTPMERSLMKEFDISTDDLPF